MLTCAAADLEEGSDPKPEVSVFAKLLQLEAELKGLYYYTTLSEQLGSS